MTMCCWLEIHCTPSPFAHFLKPVDWGLYIGWHSEFILLNFSLHCIRFSCFRFVLAPRCGSYIVCWWCCQHETHPLHFSICGVQFVVFMQSTKCLVFYPSIFLMATVILVCCLCILFKTIHCCVVQVELEWGQPLSCQDAQHIKDTGFDMDRSLKLCGSHCLPCLDIICVRTSVHHYRSHTVVAFYIWEYCFALWGLWRWWTRLRIPNIVIRLHVM